MFNLFREVRLLKEAGKLHSKLITRTRILFIVSLILGCIVIYNLFFSSANLLITGGVTVVGFVLGLFVFSKMSVIDWNEDEQVVQVGKMDALGFVVIGLYIVFEVGLRAFFKDFYPISATTFVIAGIFGTLLGRAVGTVVEIHKVYLVTLESK